MHLCTYKLWFLRALSLKPFSCYILLILIIIVTMSKPVNGQPGTLSDSTAEQLSFIENLYEEKEYYRSVSEILKITFHYPQSAAKNKLDLYLLKSFYHLGDYQSLTIAGKRILKERDLKSDTGNTKQIGILLSSAALKKGDEISAEKAWQLYVREDESRIFPTSDTVEGLVDPERAAFYSGIIPGSGLLISEQYGKAATSFMLNLLFIGGTYAALMQEQYGAAGLLFFFEISWYFGGKKASAEAAQNYNHRLILNRQQVWMKSLMNRNNLIGFE